MKLLPLMQKVPETKSTVCCGHTTVPWPCAFSFPLDLWWRHSWMKPGRNSLTSPGCCIQKYYRTTQQLFVVSELCFIFKTVKLNITCNFTILQKVSQWSQGGFHKILEKTPSTVTDCMAQISLPSMRYTLVFATCPVSIPLAQRFTYKLQLQWICTWIPWTQSKY